MSAEYSVTLTDGLHAPSHARAWVSARLPRVDRRILEDALLLVSELVTNAVRHGAPDVVLSLGVDDDRVRIEVRDAGPRLPFVARRQPSVDRPSGRGLLIVAAIAADWGVAHRTGEPGKTVWAEVRLDAALERRRFRE